MHCWKCGILNPGNATYCNQCGVNLYEVAPAVQHPAQEQATELKASEPTVSAGGILSDFLIISPSDKRGVGGWLLFFCIMMTIVMPLYVILDICFQPSIGEMISFGGRGILMFGTGLMLWMRKKEGLEFAFKYLIPASVGAILIGMRIDNKGGWIGVIIALVIGVAINLPLILYLAKSKRVIETFATTEAPAASSPPA
jgi:hypothetical protein